MPRKNYFVKGNMYIDYKITEDSRNSFAVDYTGGRIRSSIHVYRNCMPVCVGENDERQAFDFPSSILYGCSLQLMQFLKMGWNHSVLGI